ncbi:hypothetical protein TraAM80_09567 [Trypanosoma rangeli]|uniref:Uncharacterized protein n=1 Tax=Trypanosoma rangeli TaxID=5698 RepID=A0A422MUR5_TRYRA|nr:uncharacterized protein TraAM80_09567 [Trypanosoma rangeli]RNE96936.1 hypothetical protein TraAM80_09567 [Trypanosoma rangeli]|eukprot:RNE96936.1 hypothetical protein TraAM80_09567 [Trypanosoma rangeli]
MVRLPAPRRARTFSPSATFVGHSPSPPQLCSELRSPHAESSPSLGMERGGNCSIVSPGSNVTYFATNRYSWNPYPRLEVESDVWKAGENPEEGNAAPVAWSCPITMTPQMRNCAAQWSNASLSPGASSIQSFAGGAPATMSYLEPSSKVLGSGNGSGYASMVKSQCIDGNAIAEPMCMFERDLMPQSSLSYSAMCPAGKEGAFDDMGVGNNPIFDGIGRTSAEPLQGQRYSASMPLHHSQQNVSCYNGFMYPSSLQPTPGSCVNAKMPRLRFSKMPPPPVPCKELSRLEQSNPQDAHYILNSLMRQWHKQLMLHQGGEFTYCLYSNFNLYGSNRNTRAELDEPCPSPPDEGQCKIDDIKWLQQCNEWWNKLLPEKSRHGNSRRNGAVRGRWRPHHSSDE